MVRRRCAFKVIPARRKSALVAKREPKTASFAITHRSLGEGVLVGLRTGASGVPLADVIFSDGIRQLTEGTVTVAPRQSVVHRGGQAADPRAAYFLVVQP